MTICLVHNYYKSDSPSGENIVFDQDYEFLRTAGYSPLKYIQHNDNLKSGIRALISASANSLWSFDQRKKLQSFVDQHSVKTLHFHNTFPLLSPSVLTVKAPQKLMTIHNFRMFCINGLFLRKGQVCTSCLNQKLNLSGITNKCYRDSVPASLVAQFGNILARQLDLWQKHIDQFICLTNFHKDILIQGGISENRILVKPNFYNGKLNKSYNSKSNYILFIGRLSDEKGIMEAVSAWLHKPIEGMRFKVVGDGPLLKTLQTIADGRNDLIVAGRKKYSDVIAEIRGAQFLIVPSKWYEGYPMVIREAVANSIPSLVNNIGALPFCVQGGVGRVYDANTAEKLNRIMRSLVNDVESRKNMSNACDEKYNSELSVDAHRHFIDRVYLK